jgi:hypothetical protein
MSARVRPWLLFGGVGLVVGFILGIITAQHGQSQYAEAEAEPRTADSAVSPISAASTPDSVAESVDTTVHVVATTGRPLADRTPRQELTSVFRGRQVKWARAAASALAR